MALGTPVNRGTAYRNSGTADVTISAFTSENDEFLLACVLCGGSGSPAPSSLTGQDGGTAWAQIGSTIQSGTRFGLSLWGAVAAGANETIVVARATASTMAVSVVGVTGVDVAGTIAQCLTQTDSGAGYLNAISRTLTGAAKTTAHFWAAHNSGSATITPENTQLSAIQTGAGSSKRLLTDYAANGDESPTCSLSTYMDVGSFAVELAEAAGGGLENMSGTVSTEDVTVDRKYSGVVPETNGLMSGDTANNGGKLSFTILTQPANGALVTYINGRFEYTPDNGWSGTDQFTYELFEEGVSIGSATAYLVIEGGGLDTATGTVPSNAVYVSGPTLVGTFFPLLTGTVGTANVTVARVAPTNSFEPVTLASVGSIYAPEWRVVKNGGNKHEAKIYVGRANSLRFKLMNAGASVDISGTTRMVFSVYGADGEEFTIDSNTSGDLFDWSIGGGLVDIKPGTNFTLTDETIYAGELIFYSNDYPTGLVWIDRDDLVIEGA